MKFLVFLTIFVVVIATVTANPAKGEAKISAEFDPKLYNALLSLIEGQAVVGRADENKEKKLEDFVNAVVKLNASTN